ncbi:hypothetical protein K438DRAFT_1767686 [Mycena galopus ATCC 62051]|nr:hypothetical protein K438DRAFT_1767686 [Mycena galopus ATCC 62051]
MPAGTAVKATPQTLMRQMQNQLGTMQLVYYPNFPQSPGFMGEAGYTPQPVRTVCEARLTVTRLALSAVPSTPQYLKDPFSVVHHPLMLATESKAEISVRRVPTITADTVPDKSTTLHLRNEDLALARAFVGLVDTEMMVFSNALEVLRASCSSLFQRCMDHSNELLTLRHRMTSTGNQKCADTSSLATFERGSVWYDDGNLIVQAGPLIFRVFRGMLAELSPLLQELLSPQKLSTYDIFEGCPVLVVPHHATDVAHFLAAVFNPIPFDLFVTRAGFDAIVAAFRLGTTYEIRGVPRNALTLFFDVYPSNFADFVDVGLDPSYCRDQILPVIQFAREHSIDWILPLAFYRFCLEMTGRTLHRGVEYGGAPVVLSIEDQERCYDAEKIMRSVSGAAVLERYSSRVSDVGCTGGAECRASRLVEGAALLPRTGCMPNIHMAWNPEADSSLCPECLEDMEGWDLDLRQSLWDDLPGLFGLPDWTVLNCMRDAALRDSEDDEGITF